MQTVLVSHQKYYGKGFDPSVFGFKELPDFLEIVKMVVSEIPETTLMKAELAEDTSLDTFVKLAEDHRRDRNRRVDAGDETALLKYTKPKGGQGKGSKGDSSEKAGGKGASEKSAGKSNGKGGNNKSNGNKSSAGEGKSNSIPRWGSGAPAPRHSSPVIPARDAPKGKGGDRGSYGGASKRPWQSGRESDRSSIRPSNTPRPSPWSKPQGAPQQQAWKRQRPGAGLN